MAKQLIENLTSEFDPEKYRDEYREELLEMIRKKPKEKKSSQPPMLLSAM